MIARARLRIGEKVVVGGGGLVEAGFDGLSAGGYGKVDLGTGFPVTNSLGSMAIEASSLELGTLSFQFRHVFCGT